MAINEDARRKEFQDCTSFDELGSLCTKYFLLFDHFSEEITAKVVNLPIEFSPSFLKFLLHAHYTNNMNKLDATVGNSMYAHLIKAYSNRLVNEGLLEGTNLENAHPSLITVVVYSSTNPSKINTEYLRIAFRNSTDLILPVISDEFLQELFVNHNYNLSLEGIESTVYRSYIHAIDILTSDTAYQEFLFGIGDELEMDESIKYLELRANLLTINANRNLTPPDRVDLDDVYYFLTYMVATFYQNVTLIRDANGDEKVINKYMGNIFDSIEMMNLNMENYPHSKNIETKKEAYTVKYNLMNGIIDEALRFHCRDNQNLFDTIRSKIIIKPTVDGSGGVIFEKPVTLNEFMGTTVATEGYDKTSGVIDKASRKIYAGFKAYEEERDKVDSQIDKLANRIKGIFTGRKSRRDRIIEGNKISASKIIRSIVTTAAVFSFNKVAGVLYIIVKHFTSKAADRRERKRLLDELELEIKMLDEKIEDARGDGNRQAKYSMMRTRAELQKAAEQIKYGLNTSESAINTAKAVLSGKKNLGDALYSNDSNDQDNFEE